MKTAILAITLAATAFYAYTGFQAMSRLEEKVNENSERIEKIECTINPRQCQ